MSLGKHAREGGDDPLSQPAEKKVASSDVVPTVQRPVRLSSDFSPRKEFQALRLWPNDPRLVRHVELVIDPLCTDCSSFWRSFWAAVRKYPKSCNVTVLLFPLPYHTNSFIACKLLAYLALFQQDSQPKMSYTPWKFSDLDTSSSGLAGQFEWVRMLERLYSRATQLNAVGWESTEKTIQEILVQLVKDGNYRSDKLKLVTERGGLIGVVLRHMWKQMASRGVSGTPAVFVDSCRMRITNLPEDADVDQFAKALKLKD